MFFDGLHGTREHRRQSWHDLWGSMPRGEWGDIFKGRSRDDEMNPQGASRVTRHEVPAYPMDGIAVLESVHLQSDSRNAGLL